MKFFWAEISRKRDWKEGCVILEGERKIEGDKYTKEHVAIRAFPCVSRSNSLDMGGMKGRNVKTIDTDVYTLAFKRPKIIYTHNFWLLRM